MTDSVPIYDNSPAIPVADENLTITEAVPYTADDLAFADADPDTIVRATGNFATDGYAVGMKLTIANAEDAANDGTYTIAAVATDTITLATGDSLTANASDTTATLSAAQILAPAVAADGVMVHCATNGIRIRFGANPTTAGAGLLVPAGGSYFANDNELADLRLVRSTGSDAAVFIQYYN